MNEEERKNTAFFRKTKEIVLMLLAGKVERAGAFCRAGGQGLDGAAGDVKFTMWVSITLTIAARLLFSALFGLWLGWGVIGVAVGMSIDLVFRGAVFLWRLRSQQWSRVRLID